MFPSSRRSWFQFRIGAALLFIALLGCGVAWLGAEMRFVRQRQMAREHAGKVFPADEWDGMRQALMPERARPQIPVWRTMLGDEAILYLLLSMDTSDEELARMVALFPEADVHRPTHDEMAR
jgi:hypothetical protein